MNKLKVPGSNQVYNFLLLLKVFFLSKGRFPGHSCLGGSGPGISVKLLETIWILIEIKVFEIVYNVV